MFIINPDKYLVPAYRISPFCTNNLSSNHLLPADDLIDQYFSNRFGKRHYTYTLNGRAAINIALSHYNLKSEDIVSILTTSGNYYVSSCITNEIEKFCKWSREILPETKVLFVNHEFGYPYPEIEKLKVLNLPIIEDCAGSFFTEDKNDTIGKTGDFVIYSFPKMFPIQIGGLLVSQFECPENDSRNLRSDTLRYTKNVLSEFIKEKKKIIRRRISNYNLLRKLFETVGLPERFELGEGIVPGVFMFSTGAYEIDLTKLKEHFWAHGIQSSIFYGEDSYFVPVHQALTAYDIEYFYEVAKVFLKKNVG